VATIVRRGDVGGFVSSFDSDEQFTNWKNDFEADICVSLASLAGERLFFSEQNSAGVGGDLRNATSLAYWMLGVYGMGSSLVSLTGRPGSALGDLRPGEREHLDQLVETKLAEMYDTVRLLLEQRRSDVLAVAHALEVYQTITGDDVVAIMNHHIGPNVDGSVYSDAANIAEIERYHRSAADAQLIHGSVHISLPELWGGFDTQISAASGTEADASTHAPHSSPTSDAPLERVIPLGEDVGFISSTTPDAQQSEPAAEQAAETTDAGPAQAAATEETTGASPGEKPTGGWERFGWRAHTRNENEQEDPS
jgi:hypothetical protein